MYKGLECHAPVEMVAQHSDASEEAEDRTEVRAEAHRRMEITAAAVLLAALALFGGLSAAAVFLW